MSSTPVRLFVAAELPQALRRALADWRASLPEPHAPGLRGLDPDSLHLTLCFLGPQPAAVAGAVGDAVSELAGRAACPVAFAQGIWLPARRPRVLAVRLLDATGALAGLQAWLSRVLSERGRYKPESRPFLPHVTVARVRAGARVRAREPLPAVPELAGTIDTVSLLRSHLGGGPARYERLVSVRLGTPSG